MVKDINSIQVAWPKSLSTIFAHNSADRNVSLPVFQRGYDWSKKHTREFLDDLKRIAELRKTTNPDEIWYFGDVYNKGTSPNEKNLEIVDGQQRLATCYLAILCARDYFYERDAGTSSPKDNNLEWMEGYLYHPHSGTSKPDINNPIVELGLLNRAFFENHVMPQLKPVDKSKQMGKNYPNDSCKNLWRAYKLISAEFGEIINSHAGGSNPNQAYTDIRNLIDTLLDAFVILQISVPDLITAYEMFEALNHRGTRKLKDPDLIKYTLFLDLDKELITQHGSANQKQKEQIVEKNDISWTNARNQITGRDHAEYDLQNFLYIYVVNCLDRNAAASTLLRAFEQIQELASGNTPAWIKDIEQWANTFVYFRNPARGNHFEPNNYLELCFFLKKLKKINPKHAYVPIFAGYQKFWEKGDTNSKRDFELLVKVLTRYHVRNITFGNAEVKVYEMKMKQTLDNIDDGKSINEIIEDLINDPSIHKKKEEIDAEIEDFEWTRNLDILYYVLEEIEGRNGGNSGYDLTHEHIMPQSENKAWIDYIKKTLSYNEDEAKELHKEYRNKLGNLTLLHDIKNKQASTKLLVDKLPFYKADHFDITKDIESKWQGTNNNWTSKEIDSRHDALKKELLDILDIEKLKIP